jgi:hypothetical protein
MENAVSRISLEIYLFHAGTYNSLAPIKTGLRAEEPLPGDSWVEIGKGCFVQSSNYR